MTRVLGHLLAAATLLAAPLLTGARPAWAAPNLDPFGPAASAARPGDPFRSLSQASTPAQAPGTPAPQTPAPQQSTTSPPGVGQACTTDAQCPAGTICENGFCAAFERPISALLFRKEGPTTSFIPFYWSRRGNPGYRIVAPLYWHIWSPEERSRIVFPFYWRFDNYPMQRVVTVIPPYSHTKQPDAESWAVWPIFYASTKFGWAAPLLLSFHLSDPDQGRTTGLYGLFYFRKRDEPRQRAVDVFFPLFASRRSPESAFTWAFPFNFYWRNGQDKRLLVLPFFYRGWGPGGSTTVSPFGYGSSSASGQNRTGSILWVYWYGREGKRSGYDLAVPFFYWSRRPGGSTVATPLGYYGRDGGDRRGAVAWLWWFGRKADGSAYDVGFPLLWSFRSPESSTTVGVPLFWRLRRPAWSFTTFFPLYFAGRDHQENTGWKLIVPIYFSRSGANDRTFTWITPLGGYHRNDEERTRTLVFFPVVYRRDDRRAFDMVAFLYWRHQDHATGSSARLIGPYYRGTGPEGTTTTFFPLVWHFRDNQTGATAHSVLPFYFRRNNPDDQLTAAGVLPFWFYHRRLADGWSAGLLPFAFFGSRADRGHGVIFPFFWHKRDPRGTATVAAPVFYRFADKRGAVAGVPPLLYFQGREETAGGSRRYYVQFPLFWRFVDEPAGRSSTVVPPVFYTRRPDSWSAGVAPLLFFGGGEKKSHFVLFPLFWRFSDRSQDRHTTVVLNYLHRSHGDETTDALLPLLYYRRGARPGGQDETAFTLFPLLHYKRTPTTSTFISPVAAWRRTPERKAGVVVPYFWYESRSTSASGVPPLYFDITNKEEGERTRVFGPWVMVDTPRSQARVLFPVFGRYKDATESGTWVFPTFFRRRTEEGYKLDTLFPLFWWSRYPNHSTIVVGPWFRRHTPQLYAQGLVPLYLYTRTAQRKLFITPLSYYRESPQEGTSRFFAAFLFYRSTWPEGHRTVAFPFLWAGRQGPRSYGVFFPVFWRFTNEQEGSATTLAGPFFASTAEGGSQRTRGLMPLAWYSRDDKRQTASHALLPLFYEWHGPGERSLLTLPFGFRSRPDRQWWYVGPVFRRTTSTSTFTMAFPLWFSHHDRTTGTTTRVVPPLLHFSRSRPDRSFSGLLGLLWRYRDIDSQTTVGLPLFYDVHNFFQSRTTLFLPVFFRHWDAAEDTAYTIAPLFYRRSSPGDSTTVGFPLFWDFASPARRTTVFFPFFAYLRRPTFEARYIFPNIYYRTGTGPAAGTSRLFVFPFWESAVRRPGDYMWEVLLGLFGWERIGRNRYVKVLFIPFELEPAPAAQTAWYGKAPPRNRRRPLTRSLDTRAW